MKKVGILGIDLQNDFVLSNGSLSVPNAEGDAKRIADFIKSNMKKINHISLTMDSHHPLHIANPIYWVDKNGNHPAPFTVITNQDVKDGKWTTANNPSWSFKYVEELEKTGGILTIWNPHCILGTEGWAIQKDVIDACIEWESETHTPYNLWFKGSNWYTEHYSIFKAAVTYPNAPETDLNQQLIYVLNNYDEIYIVGEAMNYCVLNSIKDLNQYAPMLMKKVVILEDCMSPIGTFDIHSDPVYAEAVKLGAKIMKSTEVKL